MTLPKQAQRQADEARRLQEQQSTPPLDESPADPLPPDGEEPAVQASEPTPAPAHQPQPWEEMYHTLEGKYNAEVPRQQAQIRALTEQLAQMQDLIATMQKPAESQQPASVQLYGATPEEVDKFGADLVDFIGRVVRSEIGSARVQFQQELDSVKGQVGEFTERQVKSAEQEFFDYLDQHVPTWIALNRDKSFLQWLAKPAPFSRKSKQEFLTEAFEALDGPGVAQFFIAYTEETTPQPAPAPAAPPQQNSGIESQVQPGRRSAAGGNAPPPDTKRWSRADVAQFYTEVARGLWTNRPLEKQQREAEIFAAQREGRII